MRNVNFIRRNGCNLYNLLFTYIRELQIGWKDFFKDSQDFKFFCTVGEVEKKVEIFKNIEDFRR